MIRAIYREGVIRPLDALPSEWPEGQELEIRALCKCDPVSDTDDWINERGAFANYPGEMPPHIREELKRRIAELHALGPMEFEPGEKEQIERFWQEMDELGRQEMKRTLDQHL